MILLVEGPDLDSAETSVYPMVVLFKSSMISGK